MRMVTVVKRQRTKMMKMTLKKQRRMRMKRRKCCYQAWRGKRRCTLCSCVLQHSVEPRALGGGGGTGDGDGQDGTHGQGTQQGVISVQMGIKHPFCSPEAEHSC